MNPFNERAVPDTATLLVVLSMCAVGLIGIAESGQGVLACFA